MTDVDLNLLRVLDALLRHGSVVDAAKDLHLSAPAVSRALGRLRRATADPLFVRSGRGLEPTPHALALRDRASEALTSATAVLTPPDHTFDQAKLSCTIAITAGDVIVATMGQRLMEQVACQAPAVQFSFLPDANEDDLLRNGTTLLDLGSPEGFSPEIESLTLLNDHYVAVVQPGHELTKRRLTPKRYADAEHIIVSSHGRQTTLVDAPLAELGLRRAHTTVAPSFIVAAHLVSQSNKVGLFPAAAVAALAELVPLEALDLPVDTPSLPIAASWHRRNTNDPLRAWLLAQVIRVARIGAEDRTSPAN